MKCKNCAGEMITDYEKRMFVCPFCDTEIAMTVGEKIQQREKISENGKRNEDVLKKYFLIETDFSKFSSGQMTSWQQLSRCFCRSDSLDSLKKELEKIAEGKSECSSNTWNRYLGEGAILRVQANVAENDELIFYKDSGIISKLKAGILLTENKIFFLKKRKIKYFEWKALKKIGITYGNWWNVNDDKECEIDSLGCSDTELGVILAFICLKAYTASGMKIIIGESY